MTVLKQSTTHVRSVKKPVDPALQQLGIISCRTREPLIVRIIGFMVARSPKVW